MSRRLNRLWLLPALLLASDAWALGLGDIRLSSALNEPLRAEIVLLSATPEELSNLTIQLASAETFDRYGLDRPLILTGLQFDVEGSGGTEGNIIRVTSQSPVTEPFITFLVEAVWSRGRLLREYTLLLDPPTFAPPPVADSAPAVTAPVRSTQADSGQISRPAPAPEPAPPPVSRPQPSSGERAAPSAPLDSSPGDDYVVQRGDTLWNITRSVRPDARLTMNQTMLAIFEANPQAFAGNINLLSAGARLRIPSADDIFRISRADAVAEVQRQNAAWGGAAASTRTQPSLTLVPPDSDQSAYDGGQVSTGAGGVERATEERIRQLEQTIAEQDSLIEVRDNELAALREELARLRGEDVAPPPDTGTVDDLVADDAEPPPVEDDVLVDDTTADIVAGGDDVVDPVADGAGDVDATPDTATPEVTPPRVVTRPAADEPGLVGTVLDAVTGFWGILAGVLVLVLALLVWFARRAARGGDEESTGMWDALDADELADDASPSTERLRALAREEDESIVVVEQETAPAAMEPLDVETAEQQPAAELESEATSDTGINKSLEDTFSSETAINLDQSEPIAEADFHMAYGLYDQAADLINGALAVEPERQDLLAKLCEIYFVWGNRDAFIDAAGRMQATVGDESSPEWDKIVIMGQQIAGDHELFSGVSPGAATRAVDLSFEGGMEETGALDMELTGGPDGAVSDVIDLGAASGEVPAIEEAAGDVDFMFDEPDTEASVTREMPGQGLDSPTLETEMTDDTDDTEDTAEAPAVESTAATPTIEAGLEDTAAAPAIGEGTAETPTIEQQFEQLEATGELPQVSGLSDDDETHLAGFDDEGKPEATAEIDLDDLGLDLEGLEATGAADVEGEAPLSDLDDTSESMALNLGDLDPTGTNEALEDDSLAETGRNPELNLDEIEEGGTGLHEGLDIEDALAATSEVPAFDDDATGRNRALPELDETEDTDADVGIDTSLLDATGQTQILSEDFAVESATDVGAELSDEDKTMLAGLEDDSALGPLADDAETLLAPLDEDEPTLMSDDGDFDFAKTEALPKDVFTGTASLDETGEMPAPAGGTDMDLDLDDLTAALRVSELGDTVEQPRDEATVEQPRIRPSESVDMDVGDALADSQEAPTARIAPEDMSDDLHDARTMTEVGTKLDLARAYVDMGDPGGARSILEEVLDEGDESQRQQAQQLLDSLPG